jgi:GH24 family phage-related lysozyme (muramidase)
MQYNKEVWRSHFIKYEGNLNHFYLDTKGLVTIGIGCQVYDPTVLPLVHKSDGMAANRAEIFTDYNLIKAQPMGKIASYYDQFCQCFMMNIGIDSLFYSRLNHFLVDLETKLAWGPLDQFPENAVLALTDMAFNLGIGGLMKFHIFLNSFRNREWKTCAKECIRNGIQQERNDWTQQIFETL